MMEYHRPIGEFGYEMKGLAANFRAIAWGTFRTAKRKSPKHGNATSSHEEAMLIIERRVSQVLRSQSDCGKLRSHVRGFAQGVMFNR